MTLEQLQQLRQSLPQFADAVPPSSRLLEFCGDYGIDFGARQPELEYRAGTVRSGSHLLAVHLWLQPGASHNQLILHGYLDHSGLFGKVIEYGLSRRCNVLIFDLPGHGLSTGEMAVIDDFSEYSQAIADVLAAVHLPDLPLWVMAQSTGCAALVNYAGRHSWPFAAAVLLAPLVRPAGWLRVRVAYTLLHRFKDSVPRKFTSNSSDQEFLASVQCDPLQSTRIPMRWVAALSRWLASLPVSDLGVGPALILQGDADKTVDWRYNVGVITELFPASQLVYLPGARHQLANEVPLFMSHYMGIVDEYLAAQGLPVTAAISDNNPPTGADRAAPAYPPHTGASD